MFGRTNHFALKEGSNCHQSLGFKDNAGRLSQDIKFVNFLFVAKDNLNCFEKKNK